MKELFGAIMESLIRLLKMMYEEVTVGIPYSEKCNSFRK
tara:strand:+ start:70 stop:186 length:117 start_codon:yes stop_codon:yes gene_type:complete